MDTIQVWVRVPRRDIALLCSFIAGYEGVAIVRTEDPAQGLVELLVAPDFYQTALTLLQELAQEMDVQLLNPFQAQGERLAEEKQVLEAG